MQVYWLLHKIKRIENWKTDCNLDILLAKKKIAKIVKKIDENGFLIFLTFLK